MQQDIVSWVNGGSFEAGHLDVLAMTRTEPQRTPLWEYATDCCILDQYTDSSFEVLYMQHNYTEAFFGSLGVNEYHHNIIAYVTNSDKTYRSMIADVYYDETESWVAYQRKFDFVYSDAGNVVGPLFNMTDIPETLYWEEIAADTSPDGQNSAIREDPYQYCQDICDSYTDSLFANTGQYDNPIKTFVSAERFTNTITRNADGNISTIISKNDAGAILRKIELFY